MIISTRIRFFFRGANVPLAILSGMWYNPCNHIHSDTAVVWHDPVMQRGGISLEQSLSNVRSGSCLSGRCRIRNRGAHPSGPVWCENPECRLSHIRQGNGTERGNGENFTVSERSGGGCVPTRTKLNPQHHAKKLHSLGIPPRDRIGGSAWLSLAFGRHGPDPRAAPNRDRDRRVSHG